MYYWQYSSWACNNAAGCGGGLATRIATCIDNFTLNSTDSSNCASVPQERLAMECATEPCQAQYYWSPGPLGDCAPDDLTNLCGRVSPICLTQPLHLMFALQVKSVPFILVLWISMIHWVLLSSMSQWVL